MFFNIKDFYPSITEQLLTKSLQFATQHVEIKQEDMAIIFHSRKSTLYYNKKTNEKFDVTFGAYDDAEIYELVWLFILNQ